MKALVTGGTGFIGSHVVNELLRQGAEVRLFSRSMQAAERFPGQRVEAALGDLKDTASVTAAMDGPDLFFHVGEMKNTSRAAAEKNILLMEKIVEHLPATNMRRFIFISSITVAGIPAALPATEETLPATVLHDHYTDYKRRCEDLIRTRIPDRAFSIVRPAPVYGPGSRYLGRMVSAIRSFGPIGIPFIGDAKNIAPLIQVQDLADAIVRAGLRDAAAGEVFNITDGEEHSWFDFFNAIAAAQGRHLRIIPVPALLLKLSAAPLDLLSGPFGISLDAMQYTDYFSRDLRFSRAKAESLLDWRPAYSLAEGVKEMIAYYTSG